MYLCLDLEYERAKSNTLLHSVYAMYTCISNTCLRLESLESISHMKFYNNVTYTIRCDIFRA